MQGRGGLRLRFLYIAHLDPGRVLEVYAEAVCILAFELIVNLLQHAKAHAVLLTMLPHNIGRLMTLKKVVANSQLGLVFSQKAGS
jgi:hypothetical protein